MNLRCPVFKSHLRVKVIEGEGVFVLSELKHKILRGRLNELIAPRVNGQSIEAICADLESKASAAEVIYTIDQLHKSGLILEAGTTEEVRAPVPLVSQVTVSLLTLGDINSAPIISLLESMNVRVDDGSDLTVVLTDSYLRQEITRLNLEMQAKKLPWLLMKPVGEKIWLGPFFEPPKSACWECLRERILANHPVIAYLHERTGGEESSERGACQIHPPLQLAMGLLSVAITSWTSGRELAHLRDSLLVVDPLTATSETHALVGRPWCAICANQSEQIFSPPVLEFRKECVTQDGGYRTQSPEETLSRYGHHVSSLTGIVPELNRATLPKGCPIPVYFSGPNLARISSSLEELRTGFRQLASGKGKTDSQARAGALCEALERYSGNYRGNEFRKPGRFTDLGESAIHPNACMLYSDRQYEERRRWNTRGSMFNFVTAPFDPNAEMDWSPLWSLTRGEVRYLPTSFCYFNAPPIGKVRYCLGCSNGNAAGNTLDEAILQGFLELVERDSVALWWYNRVRRQGVNLESFEDSSLDAMKRFLSDNHRALWALDLTSDLGIPVFVALSRRIDQKQEQIVMGLGAHLDAKIALLRAVTEMTQMLQCVWLSGDRPSIGDFMDADAANWLATATLESEPYLVPREGRSKELSDYRVAVATKDLNENIRWCESLIAQKGMELLILEQTRSDVALPVVKVVVPGLRHFWARFAPGRLYDVPVQMGWVNSPLKEEELNPIPFFL